MLTVAGVDAVDTSPEQLRVTDQVPRLDAVAVHRVGCVHRVGSGRALPGQVELRILAASHQVVVVVEGQERHLGHGHHAEHVETVETVACGLPVGTGQPVRDGASFDHGRWRLTAAVRRLDAHRFRHQADAWRQRGREDPHSMVVQFPAHPDALTALAWQGEGWVGVHLYPDRHPDDVPGGGVVVHTATSPVASLAPPVAMSSMPAASASGGRRR